MKKKIIISVLVLICTVIVACLLAFFYANSVVSVTERTGKYFDGSGQYLGICKIETKMRRLADVAEDATYYFSPTEQLIGQCQGASTGAGCFQNTLKEPVICSNIDLQTQCDKNTYSATYGARPKYACVME